MENYLKIALHETSEPIASKLWWSGHFVVLYLNCVQHPRRLAKVAATAEFSLRGWYRVIFVQRFDLFLSHVLSC